MQRVDLPWIWRALLPVRPKQTLKRRRTAGRERSLCQNKPMIAGVCVCDEIPHTSPRVSETCVQAQLGEHSWLSSLPLLSASVPVSFSV